MCDALCFTVSNWQEAVRCPQMPCARSPAAHGRYDHRTIVEFLSPLHLGDSVLLRARTFFGRLAAEGRVGECFDIGTTVVSTVRSFEQTEGSASGSTHHRSAGNG